MKVISFLLAAALSFGQSTVNPALEPLRMLAGTWSMGDRGMVEFRFDIGGTVMLGRAKPTQRAKGWAEMMVIYSEGQNRQVRADSFQSDEDVIHYRLAAADRNMVQFVSPKFRLTYRKSGNAELEWRLEKARPERPGEYRVEFSGILSRSMTVRPLAE